MKIFYTFLFSTFLLLCNAGTPKGHTLPFEGVFYSKENGISLHLSLYKDTIEVPGYEFLGKMNGYMIGDKDSNLYGTWLLVSHKIDGSRAELRFSNDVGSDSQTVLFTCLSDSSFSYRAVNGNVVKKAINRRLYKIESEMQFIRK